MSDGYRNYGDGVSESPEPTSSGGSFSGDSRSYESLIVQANSPVIDWEMNLRSQIGSDYGLRSASQRLLASSFLGGDFLEESAPVGSFTYPTPVPGSENTVTMLADHALINGWFLRVEYSGTSVDGTNTIVFPAPPTSGARTDLVILEVWRALLKAAPDSANKSPTSLILRNGNVKSPDLRNLSDDLVDPDYGAESSARVQVQYRLRVIPGVNLASYQDGIDDPSVVANSVSDFSGPGADGSPTSYNYLLSSSDKGLWVAGTGDPVSAAALGTVDGLMYAQPVIAVMRRNKSLFSRSSNMNGGNTISFGFSDRPDGLYSDQIVSSDVVDLRRLCSSSYEEIMEKAFQQVLANSMSTRGAQSGLGTSGTSFLYRDDIGSSGTAGNPDGVRRYFSCRSVTDTVVALSVVGGLPQSTIVFRLSSLRLPWNPSSSNVLAAAPPGTNIAFLASLRATVGGQDLDLFDSASPFFASSVVYGTTVSGIDTVTVTLNTTMTNASVYGELAVEYPSSVGLSRNVLSEFQLWASVSGLPAWVDTSSWLATSDGSRRSIPDAPTTAYDGSQQWVDAAHRELSLRSRSVPVTSAFLSLHSASLLVGFDRMASVDTSASFVLRVRDNPASLFSSATVTAGASVPKTVIRDNLNSQFASLSLALTASVVGVNQIEIVGSGGFVGIDSLANGSTLNHVLGLSDAGDSSGSSVVMIPERLTGDPVTVNDGVNAPYATASYTVNAAYTQLRLSFPLLAGTSVSVTYTAYRPAPPVLSGNAYNLFYQSRQIQSLLPPSGTLSLRLVPRAIGRAVTVISAGPGSPDSSFPFLSPGDQVAIASQPAPSFPESSLDTPADVGLPGLDVGTGFLQISPVVPYSPGPGEVTLYKQSGDVVTDVDGRNFWPRSGSGSGSPSVYSPYVLAQGLSYGRRHKSVVPVLMELKDDVPSVGQRGMLVLVVLSAWSSYDRRNLISLTPAPGDTAASVFRVRGNALSPRRPTY